MDGKEEFKQLIAEIKQLARSGHFRLKEAEARRTASIFRLACGSEDNLLADVEDWIADQVINLILLSMEMETSDIDDCLWATIQELSGEVENDN